MEPFKNLLSIHAVQKIAAALKRSDPSFQSALFLKNMKQELEPLELKQRVVHIQKKLDTVLPTDPKKSFPILVRALKSNSNLKGLDGFLVWPLTHFVMQNGLDHHALSMKTLKQMTVVFTAEFAIRPFFIEQEAKTLQVFQEWLKDPNEHVRRLVSEGSRPLLPWGQKLHSFVKEPQKTWHFLEALKNDPSEYVQKSVANHLNDHSKHHPDWLVEKLKKWKQEASPENKIEWIIRHGTRTLVKKGHTGALALHGVKAFSLERLKVKILTPTVHLGNFLEVRLTLTNPTQKNVKTVLDHELLLLKSNGKHQPKVFKGTTLNLKPEETKTIQLKVRIKAVTTRTYYPGKQGWVLLVNGQKSKVLWFTLK